MPRLLGLTMLTAGSEGWPSGLRRTPGERVGALPLVGSNPTPSAIARPPSGRAAPSAHFGSTVAEPHHASLGQEQIRRQQLPAPVASSQRTSLAIGEPDRVLDRPGAAEGDDEPLAARHGQAIDQPPIRSTVDVTVACISIAPPQLAGALAYASAARAPSGTSMWQRTPAGANVSSVVPSSS